MENLTSLYKKINSDKTASAVPVPPFREIRAAEESIFTLPQAYATFLDSFNPWSWYFHLTSRDSVHPEAFMKRWGMFTHNLNRDIFGVRYYKRAGEGITWALGLETQTRGVIHAHGIAGRVPDDVKRLLWMDMWEDLSGYARIRPYEKGKGAEYYMSKSTYAWKNGEIELSSTLKAGSNFRQLAF